MSFLKRMAGGAAGEVMDTIRFFAGVAGVWLTIITFLFAPFHIPSESMQPTLEVGDRVLVSKWAYGYSRHSLPLGLGYYVPDSVDFRLFPRTPERGDVIVFRTPDQRRNLIKRVIGLPGDVIQVQEGRLYINGELVEREEIEQRRYRPHAQPNRVVEVTAYVETLPEGVQHEIYERSDEESLDNYGPVTVRDGYVFAMGDNRDSSTDSRVDRYRGGPGDIRLTEVVGRAETVMFTFNRCRNDAGLYCPTGRIWRGL
ncbi:signal peptidase I [Hyphobacterium sp. HN65]|uniref:Signal peptidase I n=1 Tax=Hyphobacterium lacteum TaxID=3116575 RepID=A0ABU7LMS9_9PROT|nr:signal peptidase I [Hyphobacterium sp. HN65]MEE2525230.1 signal peptidase I [Hyphobacterium sp. HN65]